VRQRVPHFKNKEHNTTIAHVYYLFDYFSLAYPHMCVYTMDHLAHTHVHWHTIKQVMDEARNDAKVFTHTHSTHARTHLFAIVSIGVLECDLARFDVHVYDRFALCTRTKRDKHTNKNANIACEAD